MLNFGAHPRPRGGYINKFRGVERLFKGYREKIEIEGALTHTSSQGGIHVSHVSFFVRQPGTSKD